MNIVGDERNHFEISFNQTDFVSAIFNEFIKINSDFIYNI